VLLTAANSRSNWVDQSIRKAGKSLLGTAVLMESWMDIGA